VNEASGDEIEMRGAAPWARLHIQIIEPSGWSADELREGVREVERILRQGEAAMCLLVGALPETRDSVADLARTAKISNREARKRRHVASVTKKIPGALAALSSGVISGEHLAALAPVADIPGAEQLLVGAGSMSPEDLADAAQQFRLKAQCGNDVAKRQRAQRMLRFFHGPDGMVGLSGLLPPLEGGELKTRLTALVDARWRVEHPKRAPVQGGHGGDTREQRTADALLELTNVRSFFAHERSSSTSHEVQPVTEAKHNGFDESDTGEPPSNETGAGRDSREAPGSGSQNSSHNEGNEIAHRPTLQSQGAGFAETSTASDDAGCHTTRISNSFEQSNVVSVQTAKPAVIILFNVDKWEAEIVGGGPIPVTASLFDQVRADLYYCFQNMVGEILKFGKSKRFPSPVQRLAVIARDRRCIYPGCTSPPSACEVHHCDEVEEDDGSTDVDVMGLLCNAHHRHLHLNKQVLGRSADGYTTVRDRQTGADAFPQSNGKAA
jgi:Domain of unknown function (DUF222)